MKPSNRDSEITRSEITLRRCRPLLGTFVEIEVSAKSAALADHLLCAGFDVIQKVQEKLSYHDPESDLSRLNLTPVGRWVPVGSDLEAVLRFSLELEQRSEGLFNVAIGSTLAGWGLLPKINSATRSTQRPMCMGSKSFELRTGMARRLLPDSIDLGGIAKGYAVDQAVRKILEILATQEESGEDYDVSGIVNAGGDLRCFGNKEFGLYLRSGQTESSLVQPVLIQNRSVATSSTRKQLSRFGQVSFHVDPSQEFQGQIGAPVLNESTCTIFARDCIVADALTKIALIRGSGTQRSRSKLQALADFYGAQIQWGW